MDTHGNASGHPVESWYFCYALQGAVIAGLTPILLPVFVSRSSSSAVGFVMAAFSLGGLAAPVWGEVADKYRLHRAILVSGLLLTGAALAGFVYSASLAAWLCLAFLEGSGASAAATVANLFIVENHPAAEWDRRIGWLQAFYGAGQVGGLLLAAGLAGGTGLLTAAGLSLLALAVAVWKAPAARAGVALRPVLRHPSRHPDWPAGSPQRAYHLTAAALAAGRRIVKSPFAALLGAWMFGYAGATVVFSQYPVLMQNVFGVSPRLSSLGFGAAAALGLFLYTPAGRWADGFAPPFVLEAGLAVRFGAIALLLTLIVVHRSGWLALTAFAIIVLAWSLLSVSSTALVARISPVGEGSGLGLFNAATAVAGVIGAAAGGWIAGRWGYRAALVFAAAAALVGLVGVIGSAKALRTSEPLPGA